MKDEFLWRGFLKALDILIIRVSMLCLLTASPILPAADQASVTNKKVAETAKKKKAKNVSNIRPTTHRILLIPFEMQEAALATEFDKNNQVVLDQPAMGKAQAIQFLGLIEQDRSPTPQGAVLVLPDIGQSPDEREIVRPLRTLLPDDGWFTLSITPPDAALQQIPKRTLPPKTADTYIDTGSLSTGAATKPTKKTNAAKKDQGVAEKVPAKMASQPSPADGSAINLSSDKIKVQTGDEILPDQPPWTEAASARITAGINYLKTKGFENRVLISVGKSAKAVLSYVKSQAGILGTKGFAIIFVDPHLSKQENLNFDKLLGSKAPFPILDIYRQESKVASNDAKLRKSAARRGQFKDFTQLSVLIDEDNPVVEKYIADWLRVHAPGQQAKLLPAK